MTVITTLRPHFTPSSARQDGVELRGLIKHLQLDPHIEGDYYRETDRARETVPSPFPNISPSATSPSPSASASTSAEGLAPQRPGFDPAVRNASTTIYYLLTPSGPQGGFHRNNGRTVHTLHRGRGRYVIIQADDPSAPGEPKRIESFIVGPNVAAGERLQWIVNGGKFKASYLLPNDSGDDGCEDSKGLFISETVVPGFEFCDHDFLTAGYLQQLVGEQQAKNLRWLLSPLASEQVPLS